MRNPAFIATAATAVLGLAAPAAQAHTVVDGDLTITNQQSAGNTTFTSQAWPTGTTGFIFLDTDRDNDSDVALIVDRDGPGTASTVVVRRADGSTAACQAFTGTEIAPAPVTTSANGGFSVHVPSSAVGADFKVMPVVDDWQPCGATDGFSGAFRSWTGTLRFTDATAPAAPAALAAVAGNGSASLDWPDSPERDVASYRVYRRAGSGAFSLVATTTASQFSDTGLTNGTDYQYFVRAFDLRNASEESTRVTVTPVAPPADPAPEPPLEELPAEDPPIFDDPYVPADEPVAPVVEKKPAPKPAPIKANGDPSEPPARKPEAGKVTPKAVVLELPNTKKDHKLVIYRRTPGGKWVTVARTAKGTYTDTEVRPGKRYVYRIVVVNKKGKPVSAGSKPLRVDVPKAKKGRRSAR